MIAPQIKKLKDSYTKSRDNETHFIPRSIDAFCKRDLYASMLMSKIIERCLFGLNPANIQIGGKSKNGTMCDLLQCSPHKIRTILKRISTEVTEFETTSAILERKKTTGNVYLFYLNTLELRRLIEKDNQHE